LEPLPSRVLNVFRELGRDRLDLHALFEAGGNKPAQRVKVLDAIENLIRQGLLEAQGGDFYGLTERGKEAISENRKASGSTK
jgi:hypothetical protein